MEPLLRISLTNGLKPVRLSNMRYTIGQLILLRMAGSKIPGIIIDDFEQDEEHLLQYLIKTDDGNEMWVSEREIQPR